MHMDVQTAKLVVYLGSVPGVGKTHRLLHDGLLEQQAGRRVAIGWIETKGRPDLDALAAQLPCIPAKSFSIEYATFLDFDVAAALASDAEIILIDELAHTNPRGSLHSKRWQDVVALRRAGKSVLTACNVYHIESVAPVAERVIEFPLTEIVPNQVLREADRVVAIDVPLEVLQQRLDQRAIVRAEDISRASRGILRPQVVQTLRALLWQIVDDMTEPQIPPSRTSRALALVVDNQDPLPFLQRVAAIADALNLALDVGGLTLEDEPLLEAVQDLGAHAVSLDPAILHGDVQSAQATMIALTPGKLAQRLLRGPLDRSLLIADPQRRPLPMVGAVSERAQALRANPEAGALTIYVGSVAGSGKTYAMLDRAQQLRQTGVDVVAGLLETHGRADTAAMVGQLEVLPRQPNGELDLAGLLRRRPQVALIDELAHTNPAQALHRKRYEDILDCLAAGIDVLTTVNIQHLEGVGEAVERLAAIRVRETVPDEVLDIASDVVFIDVSSDVLQERLRAGKIYPLERVEAALANFFRYEQLVALRELAVRELRRARSVRRFGRPFARILLGVAPRETQTRLIEKVARLAKRLHVQLWVFCITAEPLSLALHERFVQVSAAAGGIFFARIGKDAAEALAALAGEHDLVAVESTHQSRRFLGKPSFAQRLLKADAKELFVLRSMTAEK